MKPYLRPLALTGLLLLGNGVQALECEVEFRAKKVEVESKWFGNVKKTKTRSGTISGEGETISKCEENAIKKITNEGWEITYQKLRKT